VRQASKLNPKAKKKVLKQFTVLAVATCLRRIFPFDFIMELEFSLCLFLLTTDSPLLYDRVLKPLMYMLPKMSRLNQLFISLLRALIANVSTPPRDEHTFTRITYLACPPSTSPPLQFTPRRSSSQIISRQLSVEYNDFDKI
jgi:hypothetical protein